MIDFKSELEKYQPMMEMENIENSIHTEEFQDILDMLSYISKQNDLKSK
ncbi:hypothetical protein [Tyzzerella sp. An114]|nr:hypothetical protein [Tyzzerella sp. An114]